MRQALELALEALEDSIDTVRHQYETDWRHGMPTRLVQLERMKIGVEGHERAITAIKEALAQPEQEPVAYLSNKRQRLNIEIKPQTFVEIPTVTDWEMPLYMKPPQRTWVGLTDDEIVGCATGLIVGGMEFAKAIEQALKEKNT